MFLVQMLQLQWARVIIDSAVQSPGKCTDESDGSRSSMARGILYTTDHRRSWSEIMAPFLCNCSEFGID